MQRVTRSTAVAVLPAPPGSPGTPGYFSGGDPVAGVPATVPGFEWFNGVQEEGIAIITHAGLTPGDADLAQQRKAISRMAGAAVRALTVNTTLTADDAGFCSIAITANRTFTLPLANSAGGRPIRFTFARTDVSAFVATIARAGADTINGLTTGITIPAGAIVVFVSDGATAWRLVASTGLRQTDIFTASGTATAPWWARGQRVRVWGGGGGGGGSFAANSASGAGAGGGYAEGIYAATPGATYAVTVATLVVGGLASNPPTAGTNGQSSSYASLLSATGGQGGEPGNAGIATTSGTGGIGSGGNIANRQGGRSSLGFLASAGTVTAMGGMGAGGGGQGGHVGVSNVSSSGSDGVAPGGGGAGSVNQQNGTNGARGEIIVEWLA
jgi:hypothetical protein